MVARRDINVGIINFQMVFKTMEMDGTMQEEDKEREGLVLTPGDSPVLRDQCKGGREQRKLTQDRKNNRREVERVQQWRNRDRKEAVVSCFQWYLESKVRCGQSDDCGFSHMKTFGYMPDGVEDRRVYRRQAHSIVTESLLRGWKGQIISSAQGPKQSWAKNAFSYLTLMYLRLESVCSQHLFCTCHDTKISTILPRCFLYIII